MTNTDVMMGLLLVAAQERSQRVTILAGGAFILGTPVDLPEFLTTMGGAENGLSKVLEKLDSDGGTTVYLRDVEIWTGGTNVTIPSIAVSRSSIDGVQAGTVRG